MDELVILFGRRSGTSSLAKALYENGVPLAEPLDVRTMPSQEDGHYESYEVRALNVKLFKHFRCGPNHPILFPFLFWDPAANWMREHPEKLVVKEPNLCLTWPIWHRTATSIGRPLRAIWTRRSVSGCAGSLEKWYAEDDDPDINWWLVAKFYDMAIRNATEMVDTLTLDLDDPQRVEKALQYIRMNEHGAALEEAAD